MGSGAGWMTDSVVGGAGGNTGVGGRREVVAFRGVRPTQRDRAGFPYGTRTKRGRAKLMKYPGQGRPGGEISLWLARGEEARRVQRRDS
jgi:hypothetical protein